MGDFVEIAIDRQRLDPAHARQLARICPVDIFTIAEQSQLETSAEREDECILCGRCVAVGDGAVSVRRAYGARRPVPASEGVEGRAQ